MLNKNNGTITHLLRNNEGNLSSALGEVGKLAIDSR